MKAKKKLYNFGGPGDDEAAIVGRYNKTVPGLKEQQEADKKWATKYLKNEPTVIDQVKDERDNAQYYLDQVAKDKSQEPKNAQGLATGQADLSPIDPIDLIGPGLLKLGVKAASKAPGLIKQAYKVNPYAFKPDPKAAYRMIGEEGYADALESGIIRAKPSAGKWNSQTGSVEIGTPNYDAPYFSYGKPWDKDLVKGKPWMGYKGPYMAELKNEASLIENDLAYSTGQNNVYKPTRTIPTNDPNLKLYKENWLQGYKEVKKKYDVGGQLPGDDKTKTYTNKAEYDKALQAYNDSLFKFQDAVRDKALLINDLRKEGKSYTDKVFPISKFPSYQESYKNDSNKPVAIGQISIPEYEWDYPFYKKPVVKPEYNNPDALDASRPKPQRKIRDVIKTTLEQDYWNTDKDVLSFRKAYKTKFGEEPIRDASVAKYDYDAAYKAGARPSLNTEDGLYHWDSRFKADDHPNRYVDGVDTKTGKQLPITKDTMESKPKPINTLNVLGKQMSKEEFVKKYSENAWMKATGQKFEYGGQMKKKFYAFGSSSTNTVGSQYTVGKDGKALASDGSTAPKSNYTNYAGYASAVAGAVPQIVNTWKDPNTTTYGKIANTGQDLGRTAGSVAMGPFGSTAYGLQDMVTEIQSDGKYVINKDTGRKEPVMDTGSAIANAWTTDSGSSDIAAWTAGLSGKGTTTDYLKMFLGSNVGGTIGAIAEGGKNEEEYAKQQRANINYTSGDSSMKAYAFGGPMPVFPKGTNPNNKFTDFKDSSFKTHKEKGVAITPNDEVEKNESMYRFGRTKKATGGSSDGGYVFSHILGEDELGNVSVVPQGSKAPKGWKSYADMSREAMS